jgi:hypothetical protein
MLLVRKEAIFFCAIAEKRKNEIKMMLILEKAKIVIGTPPKSGLFNRTIFIPPQTSATVPLRAYLKHPLKKAV